MTISHICFYNVVNKYDVRTTFCDVLKTNYDVINNFYNVVNKYNIGNNLCDFLPRGGGVVTRRPMELRLVHLNSLDYDREQAWACFTKNGQEIGSKYCIIHINHVSK